MGNVIITETASVNGIIMPYAKIENEGNVSGKVIVVIPGLSVKPVVPMAALVGNLYKTFIDNGYTIYLFDRRTNAKGSYSISKMAEDTAEVMKSLKINKADISGTSQGGAIAESLAIRHPELVDHLMILSSVARHNEYSDKIFRRWIDLALSRKEKELATDIGSGIYSEASFEKYSEAIITANADITDEEYDRFVQMAKALLDFDFLNELKETVCSILILGARGDRIFPYEYMMETVNALGCESYFYDETYGHAFYDETTDYIGRMYEFCSRKD